MMLKVLFVLTAVCVGSIEARFGQNNIPCPCGWKRILNSCYRFVKTKVTWDVARASCLKLGGDLVIPRSAFQCVILSNHAAALRLYPPWIGVFRRRQDRRFYNTCGKQLSYARWYPGEPNDVGGNENCGHMYAKGPRKAKWNDHNCNIRLGYICQIKLPRYREED